MVIVANTNLYDCLILKVTGDSILLAEGYIKKF